MDDREDWSLVALAQRGDMDAFAALVRRYQRPVINFCFRMVNSWEDAEDMAQETFVRVYRYLNRLEPRAAFRTVLFGMARQITLNRLRDEKRRGAKAQVALDGVPEKAATAVQLPPDCVELASLLEEGLSALAPLHREVLLLREKHGFEYAEIAEVLQIPVGTVRSRLARARDELRRWLEAKGVWSV
jgi:RNA polymerase sigma-70 factor (ECF subfamily)